MTNSATRTKPSATNGAHVAPPTLLKAGPISTAQAMQVTPAMAKYWLGLGAPNRPIRTDRVAYFTTLIRQNEFIFTGEPIMFSGRLTDGSAKLMNGQHRLTGVVAAQKTVPLMVVDSVPPEAMLYLDTGARRSFADNLAILGYRNSTMIASVVRLAYIMSQPQQRKDLTTGGGPQTISHAALMAFFHQHEATIMSAVPFGQQVRRVFSASNAAMAVVWMLLTELDPEGADDFFNRLLEGGPTGKLSEAGGGRPMLALRRWLTNNLVHITGRSVSRPRATMQMAVVIKAWNAEQRGDQMTTLVWRMMQEEFPEPIVLSR